MEVPLRKKKPSHSQAGFGMSHMLHVELHPHWINQIIKNSNEISELDQSATNEELLDRSHIMIKLFFSIEHSVRYLLHVEPANYRFLGVR